MTTWIIEPRDPLIVRDGRPFGPNPGARARSLEFPFPSTTAGGVRTRDGQHHHNGIFPARNQNEIDRVLSIDVRGPLLVELDRQGEIADWLLPAPEDALLLPAKSDATKFERRRLIPLALPDGLHTNMPDDLEPVGVTPYIPSKPANKPPRYWSWGKAYWQWLLQPEEKTLAPGELGHSGPIREERMHVNIEPETQTAREGYLFLTSGLEFRRQEREVEMRLPPPHRLALAVETNAQMDDGLAPLGGERRLMRWRRSQMAWPSLEEGVVDRIVEDRQCRVLLLTPAYFEAGWQPDWLLQTQHGVQPSLVAAIVRRPQVVSGWDFDTGGPKASRRLAPAGSVYFLQLGGVEDDIRNWVQAMWMACVSDDPEQNRLDGFGLAVLGTWSGEPQALEVQQDEET